MFLNAMNIFLNLKLFPASTECDKNWLIEYLILEQREFD